MADTDCSGFQLSTAWATLMCQGIVKLAVLGISKGAKETGRSWLTVSAAVLVFPDYSRFFLPS